ncbi:hypothetical protein B0H14DRAFT_3747653 [Mycena olivaceomarginata]|nr:hypothetical protein B0H14DRAFT_3747653 [Mycena olivaceomarginata]
MSSSTQRCVLPFHPDPGQPGQPVAHQKIYLVSGPDCKKPGAYFSWPSTSTEYSKYSSASIKSYMEWELTQSAWWAGCDHGDHAHTAQRHMVLSSPRSPRPKATGSTGGKPVRTSAVVQRSRSIPLVVIPSRSPSPVPIISSSSRPSHHLTQPPDGAAHFPTKSARGVPPPEVLQGRKVYAIRARDDPSGGVIFFDYLEAQAWYNTMHNTGLSPVMVTGTSLTAAVNFAECFPELDPNAVVRRDFIDEENKACRHKVRQDLMRAAHQRGMLETLGALRDNAGPESEHELDKLDVSRTTASLESEVNARLSYGDKWRYYRSDGGHGQD